MPWPDNETHHSESREAVTTRNTLDGLHEEATSTDHQLRKHTREIQSHGKIVRDAITAFSSQEGLNTMSEYIAVHPSWYIPRVKAHAEKQVRLLRKANALKVRFTILGGYLRIRADSQPVYHVSTVIRRARVDIHCVSGRRRKTSWTRGGGSSLTPCSRLFPTQVDRPTRGTVV